MVTTYEATVYPLPSQSTWCIPNDVKEIVVLPPRVRNRAERPKKTSQISMGNENRKQMWQMRLFGYNRKTYRNPPKM